MANTRMLAMKARSEELDRKTAEIKQFASVIRGFLAKACHRLPSTVADSRIGVQEPLGFGPVNQKEYVAWVGFDKDGFIESGIYADGIFRDAEEEALTPEEIDLVYGNLDAVIVAFENFCRLVGRGEDFKLLLARFEQ